MARPDPRSVFINVPFDRRYEASFVALVGALATLGMFPKSVLDVREAEEVVARLRLGAKAIRARWDGTLFRTGAFRELVAAAHELAAATAALHSLEQMTR